MPDARSKPASDSERLHSCDCCNRMVPREQIATVVAYGIETAACDRCRRGVEELQRKTR